MLQNQHRANAIKIENTLSEFLVCILKIKTTDLFFVTPGFRLPIFLSQQELQK